MGRNCVIVRAASLKAEKNANHAFREVAFMKNRTSLIFIVCLVTLAAIGVVSRLMVNPSEFFKSIFVFAIVGVILYFLVRHFYKGSPDKKEHHAFRKAAKRSKKKYLQKEGRKPSAKSGSITSLKKHANKSKSATHLTVIEGRKGKKKNRASF